MTRLIAWTVAGSLLGVALGGTIFFVSIEMLDGRTAVSWILS